MIKLSKDNIAFKNKKEAGLTLLACGDNHINDSVKQEIETILF